MGLCISRSDTAYCIGQASVVILNQSGKCRAEEVFPVTESLGLFQKTRPDDQL
jgi:hypothetical protein